MQADPRTSLPMSWRDRAKSQMKTAHPTAKTAETPANCNSHTVDGTAKTAEMSLYTPVSPVLAAPLHESCIARGCPYAATDRFGIYCDEHRRLADDGSLLLRCVYDSHAPVAPNDPIVCAEHRQALLPDCRVDTVRQTAHHGFQVQVRRGSLIPSQEVRND